MTTLHKSVVNVLTSKFDANVVRNLGTKASEAILGIDTIKGLALTLGEMLVDPSQYKTPKSLPVVMYQPLAEGIVTQYSAKKGDVEKYFIKQGENWLISTKVEFEKAKENERHHASIGWLKKVMWKSISPSKAKIGLFRLLSNSKNSKVKSIMRVWLGLWLLTLASMKRRTQLKLKLRR